MSFPASASTGGSMPRYRAARPQRAIIALVQVAALSCWFSASAVAPSLQRDLHIGDTGAVFLTSSVQLGFVVGALTSAIINLPDRVRPTLLYGMSAVAAAACTALLALLASGMVTAISLRFLTGVALAGVYPVGMKLMAAWTTPAERGRALGILVGALTLGSAVPQLIRGFETLSWQGVLFAASAVTLAGGVIAMLLVRPGPNLQTRATRFDPVYAVRMFTQRAPRLANLGYLGHMWELYALWTWLPTFVLMSQLDRGGSTGSVVNLTAFVAIGIAGVLGCLAGGSASDRFGRAPAAVSALVVSGSCCLLSPVFFGRDLTILAVFLFVWGAAVIADSSVFSAALSETAEPHLVGTALTAQTAFGFLLTTSTIHLVPFLADVVGWRYVFVVLAIGPIIGALAMSRFPGRSSLAGAATSSGPRVS